jgi:hypothetical protein
MDASTNPAGPMAAVRENIDVDYIEFRKAAKNWSFVYHVFQFGSAVLTAASALVLKTGLFAEVATRNDVGAALAAIATLTLTLLTTGRFKEKWEANRIAAFAVRDLRYEIEKVNVKTDDVLAALQKIGLTRNNVIVGLPPPSDFKPKP